MNASLTVVAEADRAIRAVQGETLAQRVQRLQREAKQAARDHVRLLTRQLADLEVMAAEIAEGGEAYPVGVRDVARRLVEDCESRIQSIEAIIARAT